ncbi:MAG: hypothetical protein AB8I08_34585 [Sandaracinaceae bacterium]
MHPLVLVAAGLAVPLVRYLFKGAKNDRGMWSELEGATGAKRISRDGSEVLELEDGVRFSLHTRSGPKVFRVRGPCDVAGLPSFTVDRFDGGMLDLERHQELLEPQLACTGASREAMEAFLPLGLRRRLRELDSAYLDHHRGELRITWRMHGLSSDVVPAKTLIRGIRLMQSLVELGDALLLPLDRVTGVTRDGDHRVLPGGVRLSPSWFGEGPAVTVSFSSHDVDVPPFEVTWRNGQRHGPHAQLDAPSLTDARLNFDGERFELTAPLDEPGAVLEHAEYLQRLARTLRRTSNPFR